MIYVYEDHHALDLEPLSLTWATFELRCGACTHLERIRRVTGEESIALIVRDHMAAVVRERHPDVPVNPERVEAGIWLNGAALWDEAAWNRLQAIQGFMASDDFIVGGNLTTEQSADFYSLLQAGKVSEISPVSMEGPRLLRYLWDHFFVNGKQIEADFDRWYQNAATTSFPQGVHVIGDGGIYVGNDVILDPAVILDTRHGPIIIEDGVTINSHSVVGGPSYLGRKSKVWPFAFLEEVTLGPVCRVMGQLEACILQGYSNKQHGGFLGHAYLGSWINLGAGTTNSDLKNNYGPVKVTVNGKVINTGRTFVGLFMGDHVKSAIGTLFYTGTRVGVAANVFGGTTPPKVVPSFAWGGDGSTRYELEKCLETMEAVKGRRGEQLTDAERKLYQRLYHEAM